MDSAATFNAETEVNDAYEKGYGKTIGIMDQATDGTVTYKTGCSVAAFAADSRRESMTIQYSSVISDASGVDQVTASQGVTDTSSFASNVNSVISSDPTAYSSVSTVSASDITSVATATSSTVSGGTLAPTSAAGDTGTSQLYVWVLLACLLIVGVLVFIGIGYLSCRKKKKRNSDDPAAKRFVDTALATDPGPGEETKKVDAQL